MDEGRGGGVHISIPTVREGLGLGTGAVWTW